MKKFTIVRMPAIVAIAMIVVSCATKSENIEVANVSTAGYQPMSCDKLFYEARRVTNLAIIRSGMQDDKAGNDAIALGISAVLFWPALLLIEGDKKTAAEISRYKGELDAIEKVSS